MSQKVEPKTWEIQEKRLKKLEDQENKKKRENYQRTIFKNFPRTEGYELPVERVHPMLSIINDFFF